MMSSLIPSEKYSCSRSPLMLLKGSTAIADSRSRRVDAAGECRIGNGSAAPDQSDQILFTDDTVAVLHQMDQQVEDLRLHRYRRPVTKQLATLGIKRLIGKGKLHASSPGPRPFSRINQACLTDKSSAGQSLLVAFPASWMTIITILIIAWRQS